MDPQLESILLRHLPSLTAETLRADVNLTGAGLDSLTTVSLLIDIEEQFDIYLPDELVTPATFATAGSLWAAIDSVRRGEPRLPG